MNIIQKIDEQLSKLRDQQTHDLEEREWHNHRNRPHHAAEYQDRIDQRAEVMNVLRDCRAEIEETPDKLTPSQTYYVASLDETGDPTSYLINATSPEDAVLQLYAIDSEHKRWPAVVEWNSGIAPHPILPAYSEKARNAPNRQVFPPQDLIDVLASMGWNPKG